MQGNNNYPKKWQGRSTISILISRTQQTLLLICNTAIPLLLSLAVGLVVYDFGFKSFWKNSQTINFWMQLLLDILCLLIGVRLLVELFKPKKKWTRILNFAGWVILLVVTFIVLPQKASMIITDTNRFLVYKIILYAVVVAAFITEISYLLQHIYTRSVNPALMFVASFAAFILIGTFLLLLPNATTRPLLFIDALFTSASAVCITGLVVVDTATHFTPFGHFIILLLVQTGALGIMTFASLLAYVFAGSTSLRSELALRDMMSTQQLGNVIYFVFQVVLVTLLFEALGAISIYAALPNELFDRKLDKVFFSIFHSVSAFCNAGFSTLTNGLYEPALRFNYVLHIFIALLIILGGLGFPIVFNLYRYLKIRFFNLFMLLLKDPRRIYFPKIIGMNARLTLVVSAFLLVAGFISYLLFEQSATLAQHPTLMGKIVTSFFASVTPRSGGYNTVDITALALPTIMIYLLLMWIGASPASTGGGIRTTTAGVAILNVISILRGKDRVEFFGSEISHDSVRRAFAIILLSIFVIGIAVLLVGVNDSDKGLIKIAFDVVSAYSTVGLSLGITPSLSSASKLVLVVTMFVGRVGMITLLVVFVKQSKQLYYRYPKEEVIF